jgi:hypothetical protein
MAIKPLKEKGGFKMKRLFLLLAVVVLLCGCSGSGGSSSGGNYATLKNCQVCTADYMCESGHCIGPYAKTGQYRCTPWPTPAGWLCPVNYAKLLDGDQESCK